MIIKDKKPVPIYESTCPECKSTICYKKSEVSFTGYITCPVCGLSMWASTINPVRYCDCLEQDQPPDGKSDSVAHGRWIAKCEYGLDDYYECSACGCGWDLDYGDPISNGMMYCPSCGAKMEDEDGNN